jgi:hypothetical protein
MKVLFLLLTINLTPAHSEDLIAKNTDWANALACSMVWQNRWQLDPFNYYFSATHNPSRKEILGGLSNWIYILGNAKQTAQDTQIKSLIGATTQDFTTIKAKFTTESITQSSDLSPYLTNVRELVSSCQRFGTLGHSVPVIQP